ncbi:hypothetical protein FQR65_LT11332 [Abscondita terminalis]|nr:hypothetical protein FQR65_LT11332 [Abscondita terminalis]
MNNLDDHIDASIRVILNDLKLHECTYEIPSDYIIGTNVTASMVKMKVNGKDENGKNVHLHLVVKKAPVERRFRKIHAIRVIYLREIYAYKFVFPSFLNLEATYNGCEIFKSIPKYFSSSKVEYQESVVLQDMNIFGFKQYVNETNVDIDHALLLAKELGKLHASSFALQKKQPEVFRDICDHIHDVEYHSHFELTLDETTNFFCQHALKSLDFQKDDEVYNKFDRFRKRIRRVTKKVLMDVVDSEYSVVTHGDFWIPNLLFKYHEDGNSPSEVCVLDWQFLRIGSPAFDIAQLLFSCCDETIRNKHYENLLKVYYDTLKSHLKSFDVNAEDVYPYEVLIKHLKEYSVVGLMSALRITFLSSIYKEHFPNAKYVKDVKEDLEVFDKAKRNNEWYKKTIKNVIVDYINLGYEM